MLHTTGICLTHDDKKSIFFGEDNPVAFSCCGDDYAAADDINFLVHTKTQHRTSVFSKSTDTQGMTNMTYRSILSTVHPPRRVSQHRSPAARFLSPESQRRYHHSYFLRQFSANSLDPVTPYSNTLDFTDTDTSIDSTKAGRGGLRWPVAPFFGQKKNRRTVSPSCIHHSDDTLDVIDKQRQTIIDVLHIRPLILAEQMTLIELKFFNAIKPEEFLSFKWNSREKTKYAPQICASTRWFNQIIFWLHKEILSVKSVSKRAEILSHFIQTSKKLIDLNNFYSAKAVITALQVECIHRLKATWAVVSSKDRATLTKLADLFAEDDNFQRLRACQTNAQLPCIPYLGLYLNDLTYIHLACPPTVTQGEGVFTNQVRLDRINNVLRIISHFQTSIFPFHRNESVISYLESQTYLEELQRFIEDTNYKVSLRLEPPPPPPFTIDAAHHSAQCMSSTSRSRKTHNRSQSAADSSQAVSSAFTSTNSLDHLQKSITNSALSGNCSFNSVQTPVDVHQADKCLSASFLKSHKRLSSWTSGAFNSEQPSTCNLPTTSTIYLKSKSMVQSAIGTILPNLTPAKCYLSSIPNPTDSVNQNALDEPCQHITVSTKDDLENSNCVSSEFLCLGSNSESCSCVHDIRTALPDSEHIAQPSCILPQMRGQTLILSSLASIALKLVDQGSMKHSFQVMAEGPVLFSQMDPMEVSMLKENSRLLCESNIAFSSKSEMDEEEKLSIASVLCSSSSISSNMTTTPASGSQSSLSPYLSPLHDDRLPLSGVRISRKISDMSSKAASLLLSLVHKRKRRRRGRKKLRWAVLLAALSPLSDSSFTLALVLFHRGSFRINQSVPLSSSQFSSRRCNVYSPVVVLPVSKTMDISLYFQVECDNACMELCSVPCDEEIQKINEQNFHRKGRMTVSSFLRRISAINLKSHNPNLSSLSVPSVEFLHTLVLTSPLATQLMVAFPSLSEKPVHYY